MFAGARHRERRFPNQLVSHNDTLRICLIAITFSGIRVGFDYFPLCSLDECNQQPNGFCFGEYVRLSCYLATVTVVHYGYSPTVDSLMNRRVMFNGNGAR